MQMKFINQTILFLCLLTLSVCSVINRGKNEKGLTEKTAEGSGTWDTFYECPRILIATETGEYINQGASKIYAKNIESPQTDEDKLGLVFDFLSTPGELLKKIGTLISGNKYYVPYRYFQGDFKYDRPSTNKQIEGTLQDDNRNLYRMTIHFPYKRIGSYLTKEEAEKIMTFVNKYSIDKQISITQDKFWIISARTRLTEKKLLLDAASKDEKAYADLLKNQENELKSLTEKISALEKDNKEKKMEIFKLQFQINRKNKIIENNNSEVQIINEKITGIMETLDENKTKNVDKKTKIESFQKKVNMYSSVMDDKYKSLRSRAPSRIPEIDKSAEVSKNLKDDKPFLDSLTKIYP